MEPIEEAGLRKVAGWRRHLELMREGVTMRAAAEELGVTPRTVARWRRKVLDRLANEPPRRLGGRVEVAVSFPFRAAWVLLAGADDGGRTGAMPLPRPPRLCDVAGAIQRLIEPGARVVPGGLLRNVLSRAAEMNGCVVVRGEVGAARRHASELLWWMRRFRGIQDPQAYLAWYHAMQAQDGLADGGTPGIAAPRHSGGVQS